MIKDWMKSLVGKNKKQEGNNMITDSVVLSRLISDGFVIGGYGWNNTDYFATQIVKGITIKQVKKVFVGTKTKESGKITLDEAKVVQLGGPFEKIGDEDESVGGDNQKVGSADK